MNRILTDQDIALINSNPEFEIKLHKELIKKQLSNPKSIFVVKSIRWGKKDFFGRCLLGVTQEEQSEKELAIEKIRQKLRIYKDWEYKVRGTSVVARGNKQFTEEEKNGKSKKQSTTLGHLDRDDTKNFTPPVFGLVGTDRKDELTGMIFFSDDIDDDPNLLLSSVMAYDGGTYKKPGHFMEKEQAESYLKEKRFNSETNPHGPIFADHQQLLNYGDDKKYNEALMRIKWTRNDYSCQLGIFTDNLKSRLIAQFRAVDMKNNLNTTYIPISFYLSDKLNPEDKVLLYTVVQQNEDLNNALSSDDPDPELRALAQIVKIYNDENPKAYIENLPDEERYEIILLIIFGDRITDLTKGKLLEKAFGNPEEQAKQIESILAAHISRATNFDQIIKLLDVISKNYLINMEIFLSKINLSPNIELNSAINSNYMLIENFEKLIDLVNENLSFNDFFKNNSEFIKNFIERYPVIWVQIVERLKGIEREHFIKNLFPIERLKNCITSFHVFSYIYHYIKNLDPQASQDFFNHFQQKGFGTLVSDFNTLRTAFDFFKEEKEEVKKTMKSIISKCESIKIQNANEIRSLWFDNGISNFIQDISPKILIPTNIEEHSESLDVTEIVFYLPTIIWNIKDNDSKNNFIRNNQEFITNNVKLFSSFKNIYSSLKKAPNAQKTFLNAFVEKGLENLIITKYPQLVDFINILKQSGIDINIAANIAIEKTYDYPNSFKSKEELISLMIELTEKEFLILLKNKNFLSVISENMLNEINPFRLFENWTDSYQDTDKEKFLYQFFNLLIFKNKFDITILNNNINLIQEDKRSNFLLELWNTEKSLNNFIKTPSDFIQLIEKIPSGDRLNFINQVNKKEGGFVDKLFTFCNESERELLSQYSSEATKVKSQIGIRMQKQDKEDDLLTLMDEIINKGTQTDFPTPRIPKKKVLQQPPSTVRLNRTLEEIADEIMKMESQQLPKPEKTKVVEQADTQEKETQKDDFPSPRIPHDGPQQLFPWRRK